MTAEDTYKTIIEPSEGVYTEKRSKFIAIALPVRTLDEIKMHLETYQKKYYDARHVCYAYMLGAARKDFRANDNGEPSGTAGKPILGQINSNELTDILIIVVRYFGGIKLGAGGLIRAYSGSVAHAIEEIGRVEVKELTGLTVELTYSQYQVFSNFLEKEGLQEFDTTFLSDVSTTLFVEESDIERLGQELTEFYQGKVNYEKSGKKIVEVPI